MPAMICDVGTNQYRHTLRLNTQDVKVLRSVLGSAYTHLANEAMQRGRGHLRDLIRDGKATAAEIATVALLDEVDGYVRDMMATTTKRSGVR